MAGTWQWGNQFLYGYEEGMDAELQEVFNYAVSKGINLFDTADSYVESHPVVVTPRICPSHPPLHCIAQATNIVQHVQQGLHAPTGVKFRTSGAAHAGTGRLNGRSEQLLGRFIAEYPGPQTRRDGVLVATKLAAYPWRVTPGQFVAACRWVVQASGMLPAGQGNTTSACLRCTMFLTVLRRAPPPARRHAILRTSQYP